MVTKQDIKYGKFTVGVFGTVMLIAAPFTSWWLLYGYIIFIVIILSMLTIDNIRDKKKGPLDRSFGQIQRTLDYTSGIAQFIDFFGNFFR